MSTLPTSSTITDYSGLDEVALPHPTAHTIPKHTDLYTPPSYILQCDVMSTLPTSYPIKLQMLAGEWYYTAERTTQC